MGVGKEKKKRRRERNRERKGQLDPSEVGSLEKVPLKGTVDSAGPLSFLIFDSRCKSFPLPEAPRHTSTQS